MNAVQRRRYSRVRFRSAAMFQAGLGQWACDVLDLSLRGALVAVDVPGLPIGTSCLFEMRLDDETCVRMEGHIAHHYINQVGIVCDGTDLDSLRHLRRLLSLNLGDASLLDREISMMLAARA